jgi:hypothetical protein
MENAEDITEKEKYIITKALGNLSPDENPFKKTQDYPFYNARLAEAWKGKLDESKVEEWIGAKVSVADGEHLRVVNQRVLNKNQSSDKNKKAEDYLDDLHERAVKYGTDSIVKGGIMQGVSAGDAKRAYEYEHALEQALLVGESEGKTRRNMLTPPMESRPNKDYIVEDVLNNFLISPQEEIQEEMERFSPTVKKRKATETPEEYLKRTNQ